MKLNRGILLATLAVFTQTAHAHFLWASYEDPAGKKLRIEFCESPGDDVLPNVAGRSKDVQPWSPAGKVEVRSEKEGLVGTTQGGVGGAVLHYGVLDRSEQKRGVFYLDYYAKACVDLNQASKPVGMKAELVAEKKGNGLVLTAFLDGKPSVGAEIIYLSKGEEVEIKTDARGQATVPGTDKFVGRAMMAENRKGTYEGKAYELVRNYATLTIGKPNAVSDSAAYKMLEDAAKKRASFPSTLIGLSLDFEAAVGKKTIKGSVRYDEGAGVTVEANETSDEAKWVESQIKSLLLHRRSGRFEDGDGSHAINFSYDENAFGQQILVDDSMNTKYRVRDGRILEVDRTMGSQRILVNVLDTMQTPDGRVLSTDMTVLRFDSANKILGTETIKDRFEEKNKVWIPKSRSVLSFKDGKADLRVIQFGKAVLVLK